VSWRPGTAHHPIAGIVTLRPAATSAGAVNSFDFAINYALFLFRKGDASQKAAQRRCE